MLLIPGCSGKSWMFVTFKTRPFKIDVLKGDPSLGRCGDAFPCFWAFWKLWWVSSRLSEVRSRWQQALWGGEALREGEKPLTQCTVTHPFQVTKAIWDLTQQESGEVVMDPWAPAWPPQPWERQAAWRGRGDAYHGPPPQHRQPLFCTRRPPRPGSWDGGHLPGHLPWRDTHRPASRAEYSESSRPNRPYSR